MRLEDEWSCADEAPPIWDMELRSRWVVWPREPCRPAAPLASEACVSCVVRRLRFAPSFLAPAAPPACACVMACTALGTFHVVASREAMMSRHTSHMTASASAALSLPSLSWSASLSTVATSCSDRLMPAAASSEDSSLCLRSPVQSAS